MNSTHPGPAHTEHPLPAATPYAPPHSPEAEVSVLGAMILNNEAIDIVIPLLHKNCFFSTVNQKIYNSILAMYKQQRAVDIVTLCDELERRGELDSVGGLDYVASHMDAVPAAANVEYYAEIVREKAISRDLINVAREIFESATRGRASSREILADAQSKIFRIAEDETHGGLLPILEVGRAWVENTKLPLEATCMPTGFGTLDHLLTGGFQIGTLNFLAGRPGVGKSALALCMAIHAAGKGKQVAFFSLEMSKSELYGRALSAATHISSNVIARRMRTRDWDKKERGRVLRAFGNLNELSLMIDDSGGISLAEIAAKCRREQARNGIDLTIVDYVQLMSTPGRRNRSRSEEVGSLSRGLKSLAKELDVAILALSQLNRQSTTEKPAMHHLRDSGELEQDADFIGYLWKNPKGDKAESIVELHVLKQRSGPAGKMVPLYFERPLTRFTETETHQQPPEPANPAKPQGINWSAQA